MRNLNYKRGSQAIGATHGTSQGVSDLKWESLWKYRALCDWFFEVSDLHTIYHEQSGNPTGHASSHGP